MSLRSKLEAGQAVVGAFLGLRSPDAAELMSQAGYDFLLVDAEHSNIGPDSVLEMLRAIDRCRAAPLVRLSETSASHVQWALDGGAEGILFPRIRSVEDVKLAVSLCRYPPDGIRGLGPGRASGYGANMLDYAATANKEIMVMIQVETVEAVDCIDDIAAVPGVDLIFIGPGDLSQVLGIPGGNAPPAYPRDRQADLVGVPAELGTLRHPHPAGRTPGLLEGTGRPVLRGGDRRALSDQILPQIAGTVGKILRLIAHQPDIGQGAINR